MFFIQRGHYRNSNWRSWKKKGGVTTGLCERAESSELEAEGGVVGISSAGQLQNLSFSVWIRSGARELSVAEVLFLKPNRKYKTISIIILFILSTALSSKIKL